MKKCNKNWHIFIKDEKPCECGKIKDFDKYTDDLIKKVTNSKETKK